MGLQDNLKLGLEAVKYTKSQVRRSGNQHYYKSASPFKDVKRNEFLLSATRGGSYTPEIVRENEGDEWQVEWTKDVLMSQRRQQIEQIISSGDPQSVKDKKIDKCMKEWGRKYFRSLGKFDSVEDEDGGSFNSRWQSLSGAEQNRKMAKKLGLPETQVRQAAQSQDQTQWQAMFDLYITKVQADNAKKFGTGNCGEKAQVAALYLLDRTPGGLRISLYQLDPKHKGVTGIITRSGGDHAFAVLGHTTVAGNVGSLGRDAVIVDGWMNDAYPAQEYLAFKHGLNYNNERINIKQHTTRSMVCCSYRSHIQCYRDFGAPGAGPGIFPRPTLLRTKF